MSVLFAFVILAFLLLTHALVPKPGPMPPVSTDRELDVKDYLLNNSRTASVRPDPITVLKVSFSLLSINRVDIRNEQFGVTGWWSMKWYDRRLTWINKSQFEQGIMMMQFSVSEIWTPALVVSNSINDLSAIKEKTVPIRVMSTGHVMWNPPGLLLTSCEMRVVTFPFDWQTCSIQVTSIGYHQRELFFDDQETGVTLTRFSENGEWSLERTWSELSNVTEDGFLYARVTFYFQLKRRSLYYGLNILLPVLLNSLLIPLVFLLPHNAGEKMGYCLTVLLAYVVILTIVTAGLPTTTKSQALLGVYIAMVLIKSALSVVLTIHSLEIFHRSPERTIPLWQANLTRLGLRVMRLQCAKQSTSRAITPILVQEKKTKHPHHHRNNEDDNINKEISHISTSNIQAEVTSTMWEKEEEMTWKLVARVYDAFFLRLYFVIILCASVSFFLLVASSSF